MSHFIILRQRIKVIETIKKTTGAMRLISMSLHSRLRNQKNILESYALEIKRISSHLMQKKADSDEIQKNPKSLLQQPIIILIGSQKGLCGAFNENLFQFFQKQHQVTSADTIITVGKYATEYIKKNNIKPYRSYDQFSSSNFVAIADQLKKLCIALNGPVSVFSNAAPTFFSQKPRKLMVTVAPSDEDELLTYLNSLQLKATFLHILHESLLAEQAARFLSMDAAYRNADTILNQTRLDYNKTRQTYVTRELTELSGGMIAQE